MSAAGQPDETGHRDGTGTNDKDNTDARYNRATEAATPAGGDVTRGRYAMDWKLELVARGVEASEVEVFPWGSFITLSDPDGNRWAVQQLPARA